MSGTPRRTTLVTGGARRLGAEIVRSFAVVGIKVCFSHDEIIADDDEAVNIDAVFASRINRFSQYR